MLRRIGGIIAGVITWIVIVTILNLALRHGWHDYALVENAMAFTLPMMIARLAISWLSSLAAGYAAALAAKGGLAPLLSGLLVMLLFVPVHYQLWERFPIWYHLGFLLSLPLLGWAGGKLKRAAIAG